MNYGVEEIESLSFREGVRKRIAMYLGSADMVGAYNAIQEIISNSIDEYYMGYGSKIEIQLGGNTISVRDYGRGIPFGMREDGSNTLEAIFSSAHTGGKFSDKSYQFSVGLNGIGAKATCLSSEFFVCESYREGCMAHIEFKEGILTEYYEKATKEKTGTYIKFKLDDSVYNLEPLKISFDELCRRAKSLSYLTKKLTFSLYSIDEKRAVAYCSTNGLLDLIKDTVDKPVHPNPFYYEMTDGDTSVEIALQWSRGRERSFCFTNGLENIEGGTSLTGVKSAITRIINKTFKGGLSGEIARTGLIYAVNCKVKNPSFANQTKTKVNNPELRSICDRAFSEGFVRFQNVYANDLKKIEDFLIKENKANEAADRARQAVYNAQREIQAISNKKVLMGSKLKDCEEHGEGSFLLISEGDSALGALMKGRPIKNFALIPIRGKIKNLLRCPIEEGLENEEVKSIINALGCGILNQYNSKKLRYGKVCIATDADADGYNIANLLICLFQVLMPQFIEEGRLCWIRTPLFKVSYKKESHFAFTEKELQKIITKYGKGEISRFKGLGELTREDTIKVVYGDEQRIEVLKSGNLGEAFSQIDMLMGEDVDRRRNFIFENVNFNEYKGD